MPRTSTEVVFRVYKAEDPTIAALKKGEVDFVENITALQVEALAERAEHRGDQRRLARASTRSRSTSARSTSRPASRSATATPRVRDPAFRHALGYALDLDQIIEKVYQGAGEPGDTIVPPAYATSTGTPPDDEAFTFDLDRAGAAARRGRLHRSGDDGKRTMPDGSPIGTLRLFARARLARPRRRRMDFFPEWLADLGIDSKVTASSPASSPT